MAPGAPAAPTTPDQLPGQTALDWEDEWTEDAAWDMDRRSA